MSTVPASPAFLSLPGGSALLPVAGVTGPCTPGWVLRTGWLSLVPLALLCIGRGRPVAGGSWGLGACGAGSAGPVLVLLRGGGLLGACSQISREGGVSGSPWLWGPCEPRWPGLCLAHRSPVCTCLSARECAHTCACRAGLPPRGRAAGIPAFKQTVAGFPEAWLCPVTRCPLLGVCVSPVRTEPSCPPKGGASASPSLGPRVVCPLLVRLWAGGSRCPLCGSAGPWEGRGCLWDVNHLQGWCPFWGSQSTWDLRFLPSVGRGDVGKTPGQLQVSPQAVLRASTEASPVFGGPCPGRQLGWGQGAPWAREGRGWESHPERSCLRKTPHSADPGRPRRVRPAFLLRGTGRVGRQGHDSGSSE